MPKGRVFVKSKGKQPLSKSDIQQLVSSRDQSTQFRSADANYYTAGGGTFESSTTGGTSTVSLQTGLPWNWGTGRASTSKSTTGTSSGASTSGATAAATVSNPNNGPPIVSLDRSGLGYRQSSMATAAAATADVGVTANTLGLSKSSSDNTNAGIALAGGQVASATINTAGSLGEESIKSNTQKQMQEYHVTTELPQKYAQESKMQASQQTFEQNLSAQNYNQEIGLQNNQYNNMMKGYNTVTGNSAAALQQAGLPSYLAYTPAAIELQPKYTQLGPGTTSYTSKIPGNPTTSPYTGTTTQAALGWGTFPPS